MASTPDRMIIAAQCNDHSAYLAGVPFDRFFTDARTFARTQLLVTEYYGFDAPNTMWDGYNIEAEALGQKMMFSPDKIPDVDRREQLLAVPADLDRLKIPDPYKSGRMPWVHEVNKTFIELTGRPAQAYFCAPFSLAVNIRGYMNLVIDINTNPDFVHRLFTFLCDDVLVPFIEAMRHEIGRSDALADGSDAWASPPNVNLDMVDEFVVPYTERLRDRLGTKTVTRGQWGDAKSGDPERFMAQKLKCCPGFLSALDPDLYELGPRRIKDFAVKNNVRIAAGIDATLVRSGPIEAIVGRIRDYIDVMGRDGKCVIFLNHIPFDTPPEHIHAAVAAVHTYGRFPIAENLDELPLNIPQRETFSEFLRKKGETIE